VRPFLVSLLLLTSLSLSASTFKVTNVHDSGPGSLRQAMLDLNQRPCSPSDPCRIEFAIPAPVPQSGWFTIAPLSPLPVIERSPATIDGNSQTFVTGDTNPAGPEIELDGTNAGYRSGIKAFATFGFTAEGLAINRFEGHGIFADASTNVRIVGNYVGVDPTGTVALPNGFDGITLRNVTNATVVTNLSSGNRGNGMFLVNVANTSISGNRVGLARTGETAIPNGTSGIDANGTGITIQDNVVAFNTLHGIAISGNVSLFGNTIFSNGLLAIAKWPPPATPEPPRPTGPTITYAVENSQTSGYYTGFPVIRGTVQSTPNKSVVVAAYVAPRLDANGRAEARLFVGTTTVVTDGQGNATFEIQRAYTNEVLEIFGGYVTATAQPMGGTTSELSAPFPITITTPTFEVSTTADSGAGSLRDAITRVNAASCAVDNPCRISFNIPVDALTDGAARIALQSPLPALRGYVRISGASQSWWNGDTNPDGPEVEIRGGTGLQFGTPEEPVIRAYVQSLVVNGSSGDGLTVIAATDTAPSVSQPRVMISDIYSGTDIHGRVPIPNAGSGVRIAGGEATPYLFQTNVRVTRSLLSGNRQHGVLLGGDVHLISANRIGTDITGKLPIPNGDEGVHVIAGQRQQVSGNVIAFNGNSGVASDPGVRLPAIVSSIHDNGGLGIDVNDDGITAPDGELNDGTIDPPTIQSATYDAASGLTILEGVGHPDAAPFSSSAFDGQGDRFGNVYFFSTTPDPSGRGEGERSLEFTYPPVKFVEGSHGTFRIGVMGDYRGQWVSATTNRYFCYYEAGCSMRESSEFGVSVPVTDAAAPNVWRAAGAGSGR
jgi:hypothetical protein